MFRERTRYVSFTFGCFFVHWMDGKSHRVATANREELSRNAHTGARPTHRHRKRRLRSIVGMRHARTTQ